MTKIWKKEKILKKKNKKIKTEKKKKKDLQILLINKTSFIKLSKLVLLNITKIYQIHLNLVVLKRAENLANIF